MNPNDQIRQLMLRYFYDRNANATSAMGKKGSAVKISDVKAELKAAHGLKQQDVMSNLTYLLDNDWIRTEVVAKTFTTRTGARVPQETTFYRISAKGVDRIEGGSQFEPKSRFEGVNITAVGKNVITLGDGNVVNANFRELHQALDDLKTAVAERSELPDDQKLEVIADVESLKDQLAKQKPKANVVKAIWGGVLEKVATLDGVASAVERVGGLIGTLFGGSGS